MAKKSDLEETLAFQIRVAGLPAPEREYRFHPVRKWRFDFAWPAVKVAVEAEGGTYSRGRHTRGAGFADDCIKYNEAALLGWTVLRFPGKEILAGRALDTLERALELAGRGAG